MMPRMNTSHLDTATEATIRHLNQIELARRWRMSERTLERWRSQGLGPAYVKVGGHVIYRLQDIVAYEIAQLRTGHPVVKCPAGCR
jgi:hypothetical protein